MSSKEIPSLKDVIEAIGVPHVEVDLIHINGVTAPLTHLLQDQYKIKVYPMNFEMNQSIDLNQKNLQQNKFIADVHLGRLARTLRLLGINTLYQNDYDEKKIITLAVSENRVVLTRNVGLLKHKALTWGYWIRSQYVDKQADEVIRRFKLTDIYKPFSRCLECGDRIEAINKEEIITQLLPETIANFQEFFCVSCNKIYWKGSHYERMLDHLKRLKA